MARMNISREVEIAAGQNIKEYRYWMEKLAGEPVKSCFPFDFKKTGNNETERAYKTFRFADDLFTGLNKLSKGSPHALHIVLLAALTALLGKYTGSNDILIGTPIYRQETEDEFINTMLVIRNRLHSDMTFKDLLIRMKQTVVEAVEHQAYPLELLPGKLDIPVSEPNFDENFPLFDVVVLVRAIHDKTYLRSIQPDFTFLFENKQGYIEGELEYNSSRYFDATIERILDHFTRLLKKNLVNPGSMFCDIEILSEEEKKQLLFDFNDTFAEYPKDKTIRQLFEEQVARTPGNTAVVDLAFGGRDMSRNGREMQSRQPAHFTYRELDREAESLSRMLIDRGVNPDTIVGIMVDRSVEMLAGILAILKAGGAYLPIDPGYPKQRKSYMLRDSSAKVLLTTTGCNNNAETFESLHVERIFIEKVISGRVGSRPAAPRMAESRGGLQQAGNLAYIIYTSGSTGQPKGVMVDHFNVVRLAKNTDYVAFRPGDRVLPTGALEFDASTFEIWGSLLNGLKLCLVSEGVILSPNRLKEALLKNKITTMWLTSPLFNQLLQEDISIFCGLRNLLVGGDVLSLPHINRLREKYPALNIINGYGPTENTTFSTTYLITGAYSANIPIGKPIANSTAYIVDRFAHLQPVGVAGELLVGGDGVSRGYLNNPELTAEKFIPTAWGTIEGPSGHLGRTPHPFTRNCTEVLRSGGVGSTRQLTNFQLIYRTGDLTRWLPDGNIEFIGRIDQQVKIRGFRIELGEIEDILLGYDGIKDAVVVDWEKEPGQKSLCAYVVPVGEIDAVAVREYLAKELPEFMIPAYVTLLEKVPLTGNGKLDRKKLPAPQLNIGSDYAAPRNDNEKLVADIWMEVLGLDKVGIHHNFFDLGGNSIDFIKLNSKLEEELERDIPLTMMFRYPTIATFVRYLSEETYSLVIDRSTEKKLGTNRLEKMRNLKRRGIAK